MSGSCPNSISGLCSSGGKTRQALRAHRPPSPLHGSSWSGGTPSREPGSLCGAPGGRCSNPEPCRVGWGGAEQGGKTAEHPQECQSHVPDPKGALLGRQAAGGFPTHQQCTGCPWAARVAPLSVVGLTAPSSSRSSVPACPSIPSRGD